MKTKLIIATILIALCSISASAMKKSFFSQTLTSTLEADGWSVEGGTVVSANGTAIIRSNGGDVVYTRTATDSLNIPTPTFGVLGAYVAQGDNGTTRYDAQLVLTTVAGTSSTFNFSLLDNASKLQVDTVEGSVAEFDSPVIGMKVIFKSLPEGTLVRLRQVSVFTETAANLYIGEELVIQAENYDEGGMNVAYYTRRSDSSGYREDSQGACINGPNDMYGNRYCIENMGENWSDYTTGEYVDNSSNEITPEMARHNWGNWYNYSVTVTKDCWVDVWVRTGVHWGSYGIISNNGATGKWNKSRSSNGYVVQGVQEDWVRRYSGAYVFKLDGKDMKGYQTTRAKWAQNGDFNTFYAIASDSTKWSSTLIGGENNDTIWCWPIPDEPNTWRSHYGANAEFQRVFLSRGTHVFTMASLASQFHFDEFKLTPAQSSAVEDVKTQAVTVIAGSGYIEVTGGDNVAVYSISGALVGLGKQRIDVPAGVYVVVASGIAKKVIVRN